MQYLPELERRLLKVSLVYRESIVIYYSSCIKLTARGEVLQAFQM
jgi:hypothetical protein